MEVGLADILFRPSEKPEAKGLLIIACTQGMDRSNYKAVRRRVIITPRLINSGEIISSVFSAIRIDCIVVATLMLNAPAVHPSHNFAIHCPCLLQRRIAGTHDHLADVIKAVVYVIICDVLFAKGKG
jgi:hypothetical protein